MKELKKKMILNLLKLLPVVLVFFALTVSFHARAQEMLPPVSRELIKKLKQTGSDTNRMKILLQLGQGYVERDNSDKIDLDSAHYFLNQAKTLAYKLGSQKFLIEALKQEGNCYLEGREFLKGKACFMQVANYFGSRHDNINQAITWERFGQCIPETDAWQTSKVEAYHFAGILYKAGGDNIRSIETQKTIADIHLRYGKLDLAEKELIDVIGAYKAANYKKLHDTYFLLGAINGLRGYRSKELYYDILVVKSMEATRDTAHADQFYFNLGQLYSILHINDQAMHYYSLAMASALPIKSIYIYYVGCIDKVRIYLRKGQPEEADRFLNKAVKAYPTDRIFSRFCISTAKGMIAEKRKQNVEAESFYKQMVSLGKTMHDKGAIGDGDYFIRYQMITEFFVNTRQYAKVRPYLTELLKTPKGISWVSSQSQLEFVQYKIDSANASYLSAFRHYDRYKKLSDSAYKVKKETEFQELNIKYQTEQKDKDFQILTSKDKLHERELDQAGQDRKLYAMGLALLLIVIAVIWNRFIINKRNSRKLEMKQKEISAKNRSLERLLQDNEWLLREVHHRVKNNLQIVMSLLTSQSVYLQDEAALNAVMESQHRVQAMSLIHQKLYKNDNISDVYMPDYINDLLDYLQDSYQTKNHIHFDRNVEALSLDVSQAVPLGLILNETVTNAIKHAFAGQQENVISVCLKSHSEKELKLIVTDNGTGLPDTLLTDKTNSFGITLMRGLVADLGGSIEITNAKGTTLTVTFQKETILNRKDLISS
jgi:two-component sensor histidine kinase